MDEAPDKAARAELMQRLARFEPRTLELLGEGLVDAPPARVAALLQVVVRVDARTAVAVARSALKSGSVRTKELALKAMIEVAQAPALALLGMAAGAKGDDVARRLLVLGTEVPERRLQELQLVATSALGLTRSAEAVPHLITLLTRQSLLTSRFAEEQRVEAARALAANGTREAAQVLRAGAEHKKKNVREACERALKGRG
jgi:HEAT repeat protein